MSDDGPPWGSLWPDESPSPDVAAALDDIRRTRDARPTKAVLRGDSPEFGHHGAFRTPCGRDPCGNRVRIWSLT